MAQATFIFWDAVTSMNVNFRRYNIQFQLEGNSVLQMQTPIYLWSWFDHDLSLNEMLENVVGFKKML